MGRREARFLYGKSVSWRGWFAFAIALSMVLSVIPAFRPSIGGSTFHPYLAVVGLAAVVLVAREGTETRGLGLWGWLLILAVVVPDIAMAGTFSPKTAFKWVGAGLTFFVVGRLAQRRADFTAGALGIITAVGLIAGRGLLLYGGAQDYYLNALPGVASRNAFTVWAGSAFAVGIPMLLAERGSRLVRGWVSVCVVVIAGPLVLSLSRGSWVLLAAALFPLVRRMSLRAIFLVGVTGLAVIGATRFFEMEERIEGRYQELIEGTASDDVRKGLIVDGLEIFSENPVWGVGLSRLPLYLERPVWGPTESHNQFIDMLAGTGLVGTSMFVMVALRILKNRRDAFAFGARRLAPEIVSAPLLLLGLIIMAGTTSNEVLYCPALIFCLGGANAFLGSAAAIGERLQTRRRLPAARRVPLVAAGTG